MSLAITAARGSISSPEVAEGVLDAIDPDCSEEVWRHCAAALKNVQGGFDIFDRWSAQSHKYPGTVECESGSEGTLWHVDGTLVARSSTMPTRKTRSGVKA